MVKATSKRLSRQRFFEVKQVMEDYNKDLISLAQFIEYINTEEAEAFEYMFKQASFDVSKIEFSEFTL